MAIICLLITLSSMICDWDFEWDDTYTSLMCSGIATDVVMGILISAVNFIN